MECTVCHERGFVGYRGVRTHMGLKHHRSEIWIRDFLKNHKHSIRRIFREMKMKFKDTTRSELIGVTVTVLMTKLGISSSLKPLLTIAVSTLL